MKKNCCALEWKCNFSAVPAGIRSCFTNKPSVSTNTQLSQEVPHTSCSAVSLLMILFCINFYIVFIHCSLLIFYSFYSFTVKFSQMVFHRFELFLRMPLPYSNFSHYFKGIF